MPRTVYTKELLQDAANQSVSIAGVLRALGIKQAGGSQSHVTRMLKKYEIDCSHFTGQSHNRGKRSPIKMSPDQILVVLPEGSNKTATFRLRRALLEAGVEMTCVMCGLGVEYNGKPIVLEIDHINENWLDNRKENLQFLCPNCHSQKTQGSLSQRQRKHA